MWVVWDLPGLEVLIRAGVNDKKDKDSASNTAVSSIKVWQIYFSNCIFPRFHLLWSRWVGNKSALIWSSNSKNLLMHEGKEKWRLIATFFAAPSAFLFFAFYWRRRRKTVPLFAHMGKRNGRMGVRSRYMALQKMGE